MLCSLISSCGGQALTKLKVGKMVEKEDRWLSADEICRHLGVSKDTVYKWIDKHDMPAHRMGRLWKFKVSQVDAWIEAGGATGPRITDEETE